MIMRPLFTTNGAVRVFCEATSPPRWTRRTRGKSKRKHFLRVPSVLRGGAVKSEGRHDAGIALVVVLLALVLLSAVGVVLVLTTTAETRIAANFRSAQQGLYAADAAAECAMDELRTITDWNALLGGPMLSSFVDGPPGGTRRLDDGSVLDLVQLVNIANCQKATACTAAEMNAVTDDRPWGPNNPRWKLFAYGRLRDLLPAGSIQSPWYVVAMVGDDAGETDNDPDKDGGAGNPGAGVIALRAEAFAGQGAHKVIELTVAHGESAVRMLSWREIR